ncbi:MAG TPA: AMP-binding protein [Candidatus Limnocylindrales bacterium]
MPITFPDPRTYASLLAILEDAARRRPDEIAMSLAADAGREQEWSATELLYRSRLAAARLQAAGLGPGDRLLTWCPSGPDLTAVMFGAIRLGVVIVPLDLRMAPEVIERIAARADTRVLAIGVGRDAPDPRELEIDGLIVRTVPSLIAEPGADGGSPLPDGWQAQLDAIPMPGRATLFEIVFTSGTTGSPKGAMLTHGNLLATIEAADQLVPRIQHRIVSLLPLSHLFGQLELGYALLAGAPILYLRSRNPRVIFEAIRAHEVTTMVVVPQVLDLFWSSIEREVAKSGRSAQFERLRSIARRLPYRARRLLFRTVHERLGGQLGLFVCSAAFLPPALQQAWEDLGVVVLQGFGSTECGFAVANRMDDHPPGVVGRSVDPVRVRIDPQTGEVLVAGPTVFQGYWRDPEATAAAIDADGWFHTGDIGHEDDKGRLVLSGRIKNMIALPNGLKVYPEDMENVLRESGLRDTVVLETTPGRIEAVVLPPDAPLMPTSGAAPEPRARSAEDAAELRERIDACVRVANARLGMHQRIVAWRLWPDADFPRTHTLKVRRPLVEAWVAADAPPRDVAAQRPTDG